MPASGSPAAPAGDYQVRRAGPADHEGVVRELAAYFAFLGEDLDPDGLDHDVAEWQGEYDGVAGVMLVVAPRRCAAWRRAWPSSSACGCARTAAGAGSRRA